MFNECENGEQVRLKDMMLYQADLWRFKKI